MSLNIKSTIIKPIINNQPIIKNKSKSIQPKCTTGPEREKRNKSAPSRCNINKATVGNNLKYTSDNI
jgi:hypothetical protein